MKHIFLSHSSKDARQMAAMRENLLRLGYRPWIDSRPAPGRDWRFDIDDAIRAADAIVVLVSPTAAESIYVTYEWSLALGLGIPVVPVIISKARMHPRLQVLEHLDMTIYQDKALFWEYFAGQARRLFGADPDPKVAASATGRASIPAPQPEATVSQQPPSYTRQAMPPHPGYWLVMRRGPQVDRMIPLAKDVITLGRDDANDIYIDDPEVSRYHLRLQFNGQNYVAEDLKSTNGTRINGGSRIKAPTSLQPGHMLMLGDTIILSYEVVEV